jgi:hypothetical protein
MENITQEQALKKIENIEVLNEGVATVVRQAKSKAAVITNIGTETETEPQSIPVAPPSPAASEQPPDSKPPVSNPSSQTGIAADKKDLLAAIQDFDRAKSKKAEKPELESNVNDDWENEGEDKDKLRRAAQKVLFANRLMQRHQTGDVGNPLAGKQSNAQSTQAVEEVSESSPRTGVAASSELLGQIQAGKQLKPVGERSSTAGASKVSTEEAMQANMKKMLDAKKGTKNDDGNTQGGPPHP